MGRLRTIVLRQSTWFVAKQTSKAPRAKIRESLTYFRQRPNELLMNIYTISIQQGFKQDSQFWLQIGGPLFIYGRGKHFWILLQVTVNCCEEWVIDKTVQVALISLKGSFLRGRVMWISSPIRHFCERNQKAMCEMRKEVSKYFGCYNESWKFSDSLVVI